MATTNWTGEPGVSPMDGTDRFCCTCGEPFLAEQAHNCEMGDDEPGWCGKCGAELTDSGDCHNEHDDDDLEHDGANTPGPWNVEVGTLVDNRTKMIQIVSPVGAIAMVYGANNPDDETMPNARLMAAAPAMASVLRGVLHQMTQGEASDIIDGEIAQTSDAAGPFEKGTVGRQEADARRDLKWCRRQIETVLKSIS